MAKRAWSRGNSGIRPAGARLAFSAGAALCLACLGGCSADKVLDAMNPVTWYRDVTGSGKPQNSADADNQANLESGSSEPTPNLSTVPNEPTRGLTQAERDALAQGLVADRDHAHYTDEQVRNGDAGAVMPPQSAVPEEHLPGPAPAPVPPLPPVPQQTASAAPPAHAAAPPPPANPVGAAPDAAVAAPTPRETPEPEALNPPPAPPQLKPLPPPEPDKPLPGTPPAHPEPAPGPAEIGGVAVPAPPPVRPLPTPGAPSIPPAPQVAAGVSAPIGKYAKSTAAGSIVFAGGAAALPADAAAEIAAIPALHKQYGGIVRIVGYAAPASGPDASGQQLAAYQAALVHANAVKQALIADGVPETEIVTEASPIRGVGATADRADIYVQY